MSPASELCPAAQLPHTRMETPPFTMPTLPAGHEVQEGCPGPCAKLPAGHEVQLAAPAAALFPDAQSTHVVGDVEYFPAPQSTHWPSRPEYRPEAQAEQSDDAAEPVADVPCPGPSSGQREKGT